jgi:hypothetical protein
MWNWSYGDGTWFNTTDSALRNVSKTYNTPGSYVAQLTVSNSGGSNTTIPGTAIMATPGVGSTLGEAVDALKYIWTTGGNADWFAENSVYYYDKDAAQSGKITHSQASYLNTTVTGSGTLRFWWKVSSEYYYDYLRFYIDGVQQTRISGTTDWRQQSYSLGPGTHTVEWRYTKNGGTTRGSDGGWVDKVEFSPNGITVMTPNGGETWQQGSAQTITWQYAGNLGSYVKIELLKGTAVNQVIASGTSIGSGGSGSRSWMVPYNQGSGSDYKIRITSTSNAGYTDTSDTNFTISAGPPITVVSPNGGENWHRESTYTIRWQYSGSPGSYVKIELLNGTAVSRVISSSTPIGTSGSGSKSWTIPSMQNLGTNYKIRITSTNDPTIADTSNMPFTISRRVDYTINPFD